MLQLQVIRQNPDEVRKKLAVKYFPEPELVDEGCLSVPGFFFPRLRYPFARVTGIDLDGNPVELSGDGLMAQALQHEVDHLEGHLYIEGLEPEVKREAMRAIRQAPWY